MPECNDNTSIFSELKPILLVHDVYNQVASQRRPLLQHERLRSRG
jgi:hypothetical protein